MDKETVIKHDEEEKQYLLVDQSSESRNIPSENDNTEPPDGGWGWIVVLACFLTTFTLDGIGYSFGMFMEPLKQEMGEGNFGVASVGSIQVGVDLIRTRNVFLLVTVTSSRFWKQQNINVSV